MNKLKDFWGYIVGFFAFVSGILIYYLSSQKKEIDALKTEIELTSTKQKARDLDKLIEVKKIAANNNVKKLAELDKAQTELHNKKIKIAQSNGAMTPKQIEEFWK